MNECPRHRFPSQPEHAAPYYVPRCHHIGRRFIVEIRNIDSAFTVIDYVEDGLDGEVNIVEYLGDDETAWQRGLERMRAGDGPKWNS